MAPTIANQWTGGQTLVPVVTVGGLTLFPPVNRSQQTITGSSSGNWLFAIICLRQHTGSAGITLSVSDNRYNWWEPLGAPNVTSSATGVVRVSVWVAPAAQGTTVVNVAPTGFATSIAVNIIEVAGMPAPWLSPTAVANTFANSATSLSAMSATPSAAAIIFTACASDNNTATIAQTGAGWTALTAVPITNGTDHTQDLTLTPFWQLSSSAVTSTFTSTVSQDLAGVLAGAVQSASAPSQPSPTWPSVTLEVAPAAGASTPPDQITWVNVAAPTRFLNFTMQQGKQYELDQLQSGTGTITFDDPDGALIPPGTGAYAGIGSGTPVRLRTIWQGGAYQAQFHGNGSTATPGMTTGNVFAVVPGQVYSAAAFVGATFSGGNPQSYTSGATVVITFSTGGGTPLSTATGTTASDPILPQLVTATGTAPATAALASITISAVGTPAAAVVINAAAAPPGPGYLIPVPAVTWSAVNSATVTTLASWKYDRRGIPVVTPHGVTFNGFFERLPPAWDPNTYRGQTQATIVDAWNYITGNVQPILPTEILNDGPYAYWPMTDAAGAIVAANQASGNSIPLTIGSSKYGNGGASEAFGQDSSAILGAQGTYILNSSVRSQAQAGMWGVTLPNTTAIPGKGFTAFASDPNYPAVGNGVTIEFWFIMSGPFPASTTQTILTVGAPSALKKPLFNFGVTSAGFLDLFQGTNTLVTGLSLANFLTTTTATHVALTFNTTTYSAWVNGVNTTFGSWPVALAGDFTEILVNGDAGLYATISAGSLADTLHCMGGAVAHVAVHKGLLANERIITHYDSGAFGMAGDSSAFRIERLLGAGNFGGRRLIVQEANLHQTPVVSCQDISGQPATSSVNNVLGSLSPAFLFVASTGALTYLCREVQWNSTVRHTFGENIWAGEIPYTTVTFDNDPTKVLNSIQITQLDNQDVLIPQFNETGSRTQFGTVSHWTTGYLQGDITEPLTFGPGLQDLANWLATTFATAPTRISGLTVSTAAIPAAWGFYNQVQPGRSVVVNRRPPTNTGELISVNGRITQVSRSLDWRNGTGTVTLLIDADTARGMLSLDDTTGFGLLNGVNRFAW